MAEPCRDQKADCLGKYIFHDSALVQILLNLSEVREELKITNKSIDYSSIDEGEFGLEQVEVLKGQLNKYVTPALTILLLEPRPYKALRSALQQAFDTLQKEIKNNKTGAKVYRDDVFYQFRRCSDRDHDDTKLIQETFETEIRNSVGDADAIYFYNVFQQGLLRAWAQVCSVAVPALELPPQIVAEALVSAWDVKLFDPKKPMFDPFKRPYVQGVLFGFGGARVRLNETAREQWSNLIIGSLLHEAAMAALIGKLSGHVKPAHKDKLKEFKTRATQFATEKLKDYLEALNDSVFSDMKKNWPFKDLDAETKRYLEKRVSSDKEDMRKEFEDKIRALTKKVVDEAQKSLSNILDLHVQDLP